MRTRTGASRSAIMHRHGRRLVPRSAFGRFRPPRTTRAKDSPGDGRRPLTPSGEGNPQRKGVQRMKRIGAKNRCQRTLQVRFQKKMRKMRARGLCKSAFGWSHGDGHTDPGLGARASTGAGNAAIDVVAVETSSRTRERDCAATTGGRLRDTSGACPSNGAWVGRHRGKA